MSYEEWLTLPRTMILINNLRMAREASLQDLLRNKDPELEAKCKAKVEIFDMLSNLNGLKMYATNLNEGQKNENIPSNTR